MTRIERVPGVHTLVGESPVWDPATRSLWFIDILGNRLGPDDELDSWTAPESPGAVATTADGGVAVALEDGFRRFDPATGDFGPLVPAGVGPADRISEGKADRRGRLLAVSGDRGFREPVGRLVRLEPDGSTTTLREGIHLGNGLCFSPDGGTLYLADSLTGTELAYDYDDAGLSNERVLHSTAGEGCFPDGATVDAEGCVWIVLHHAPFIVRVSPDGAVLDRLELPTPNITSLAFGGPDLDVLHVTSLDPAGFAELPPGAPTHPGAEGGLLYRVTGLGVRGIAETPVAPGALAG